MIAQLYISNYKNYYISNHRFAFNGKENDNEVKGIGNQQDYGFRIYDPRIGRFLSADPLIISEQEYPELSSYQFSSNSPIENIDLDGLEKAKPVVPSSRTIITITTEIKVTIGVQLSAKTPWGGWSLNLASYKIAGIKTTTKIDKKSGKTIDSNVEYDYPFNGKGSEITQRASFDLKGIGGIGAKNSFKIDNDCEYVCGTNTQEVKVKSAEFKVMGIKIPSQEVTINEKGNISYGTSGNAMPKPASDKGDQTYSCIIGIDYSIKATSETVPASTKNAKK